MGIMDQVMRKESGRTRDTEAKGVGKVSHEAVDESAFTDA